MEIKNYFNYVTGLAITSMAALGLVGAAVGLVRHENLETVLKFTGVGLELGILPAVASWTLSAAHNESNGASA
ncbi:MAG: hypothetical protein HYT16_00535 [DPANN group archaeon]|nr:hypothetical protein [DPANN group archaeon]